MDIVIVCHTEFGYVHNQQIIADKKAIGGVTVGVRKLISVAENYGAKVTFAVCPEVAEYFPEVHQHEIGLHIHAGYQEFSTDGIKFYVGDEYLWKHSRQLTNSSVLRDHSYQEQMDMISKGKDHLADVLGVETKSFVAGRWSINNDTIEALVQNGFTHECSALPHSKPSHYEWSELPRICMPYHPDKHNYQKKGDYPILIVPTSQVFPIGQVNPEFVPEVGLSWLKAGFREYYNQNLPLFHICLHSPCMTNEYFISVFDELLSLIAGQKGINFKCASEIKEYEGVAAKTYVKHYLPAINRKVIWKFIGPRLKKIRNTFSVK